MDTNPGAALGTALPDPLVEVRSGAVGGGSRSPGECLGGPILGARSQPSAKSHGTPIMTGRIGEVDSGLRHPCLNPRLHSPGS